MSVTGLEEIWHESKNRLACSGESFLCLRGGEQLVAREGEQQNNKNKERESGQDSPVVSQRGTESNTEGLLKNSIDIWKGRNIGVAGVAKEFKKLKNKRTRSPYTLKLYRGGFSLQTAWD